MGGGNGKPQTGFVEILTMDERFQTLGTETDSCHKSIGEREPCWKLQVPLEHQLILMGQLGSVNLTIMLVFEWILIFKRHSMMRSLLNVMALRSWWKYNMNDVLCFPSLLHHWS